MFTGHLTETHTDTETSFTGMIHARDFDIAITLVPVAQMAKNSPTHEITARNKAGRTVRIGSAWDQASATSGNRYISMQIDVGRGPFRVNAVQTEEGRRADPQRFDIIPFANRGLMNSSAMSGELTAMDADNAFAGFVASMSFDLEFMLIENDYKTEDAHPDYRIETSSPRGEPIRVGSAWMAQSKQGGNDYISLLINTPDGDLRLNAVQNAEQRGGNAFSIIPFVAVAGQEDRGADLRLVG